MALLNLIIKPPSEFIISHCVLRRTRPATRTRVIMARCIATGVGDLPGPVRHLSACCAASEALAGLSCRVQAANQRQRAGSNAQVVNPHIEQSRWRAAPIILRRHIRAKTIGVVPFTQ